MNLARACYFSFLLVAITVCADGAKAHFNLN